MFQQIALANEKERKALFIEAASVCIADLEEEIRNR